MERDGGSRHGDEAGREGAEEALRASEERSRSILQTAAEAFISIDASGAIREWNPAAETSFGWAKGEVLGRPLAETLIPERFREAHTQGLVRFLETGEGPVFHRRLELAALHRSGREIPIELTIWPLRLGDSWTFNAFVRDISDRRALEDLREQVRTDSAARAREHAETERLRALDDMKSTFLGALSHELRTPLTNILGLAQTLSRYGTRLTPEDQGDLVGRLVTNAERLERLLGDILDLDRFSRVTGEGEHGPTDVSTLVRDVAQGVRFLDGRSVEVDVEQAQVTADPANVERIVDALLSNVAKHTASGTPVWIRVRSEGAGALIIVEDAGPGVPDVLKEFVFKPFERGPDVPAHSPGTGIGLTLVSLLSGLSGGRAWVEDRVGGGASFRVYLPGPAREDELGSVSA